VRFGTFHQKQLFFREIMVPSCRMRNIIACCGGILVDQWLLGIGKNTD
jgi:hypothetical protein